ncbi:MAG: tRNA (adenosine(37)-N6)-threonylcarbamoyltransferase complex ATPase subunit type 1 TsaE [Taibaiella sp.]|nr:tRNA (adenosine(37)-N6)-threonylcarbamoyltransferase complex ATPase subunit type 1 TsaE [Taibaiella sp.]
MEKNDFRITYTLSEIAVAAAGFSRLLNEHNVFAFSGEMSAGKTTFIHHLCDVLQVEDTVSSPTFSLINEYHCTINGRPSIIFHMDLYRLKSVEEAINAGIEDCLLGYTDRSKYFFVEWPEIAPELLFMPHLWVRIETLSETERQLEAAPAGKPAQSFFN